MKNEPKPPRINNTQRNKEAQSKARTRRTLKRIGQAAQKRKEKRLWLAKMRKENPNFGTKQPAVLHVKSESKEEKDGLVYSASCWWEK